MRPSSARLLGCAGVCFFLIGAGEGWAGAAELSVSLRYVAGPACPDAGGFKSVVVARLGYDPFRDDAPDHVLVRIAGRGNELDGRIEWRDSQGTWTGDQAFPSASADCSRLARAMGLALAVQIQLLAGTRAGSAPEPAPATPAPGTAIVPPPPQTPPAPLTEPGSLPVITEAVVPPVTVSPQPIFAVGAGPSLGIGLSSQAVLLGRVFGTVIWPGFSVEFGAQASLPTTPRRMDGAGFSQRLILATTSACLGGVRWSGCLLVAAGVVRMAGQDIELPKSEWAPIADAGARVGFTQRLGSRAFLFAHADGVTHLVRWRGKLDEVPVWTAPPFAVVLGVDAGMRFH